ncbi:ribulose-phosphate 3-epimerase [Aureococcus anophagefferens]|nr:ribulose-phosphate 3-epimerase [Aureococcus anophagefferens]
MLGFALVNIVDTIGSLLMLWRFEGGGDAVPHAVLEAREDRSQVGLAAMFVVLGLVIICDSAYHYLQDDRPTEIRILISTGLDAARRRARRVVAQPRRRVQAGRGDGGRTPSLCLATTSCTVVACDAAGAPLRDCLLWMDARSATEAEDILEMGAGDPALRVNSGGAGPISAEWMLPKALWLKRHEPETWDNAAVVCECQDWLNFKLTGGWAAGGSNVATRWHCDGAVAVAEPPRAAGPSGPSAGGRRRS